MKQRCRHYLRTAKDDEKNRCLLGMLSSDRKRSRLFRFINQNCKGELVFPSRDSEQEEFEWRKVDSVPFQVDPGYTPVKLVTERGEIKRILEDPGKYSSRVYAGLGGGSFMLALDPPSKDAHQLQRDAFNACFLPEGMTAAPCSHATAGQATQQPPRLHPALLRLCREACEAAAVIGFRSPEFDLANYAEQAALRYCQLLMGYATKDYQLLESTMRVAYRALVHQVFGRHFVTDRVLIPEAKLAMGRLLTRTAALIDAYASDDADELKGTGDPVHLAWKPALKRLAELSSALNGEQRAIVAVGAAIGTVGNVQAAVCIAVQTFFAKAELRKEVIDLVSWERCTNPLESPAPPGSWTSLIGDALHANPPIPYLPRVEIVNGKPKEYLLALGGGTLDSKCLDDPLLWGSTGCRKPSAHSCVGQPLAWPLIVEIVRTVMGLPGIEQALDPETGRVKGLEKRHGFACVSYPLTHRRDRLHVQTSLNVTMRIKSPVRENAERLRNVIRTGAPRIQRALHESAQVHFAWFEFIENDTVLVLHTVYDGSFEAYLQHFALCSGDLFDLIFECIEDPPPMPVDKFPTEFVAHLLRYDRKPALGYFFSAYPDSEVARILRNDLRPS